MAQRDTAIKAAPLLVKSISILLPAARRRWSWCDKVCLLGVRAGPPAGPLGHSRLQDCPRQQRRHNLLLRSPHTLCHPHVVRTRQRECSSVERTPVTEQWRCPSMHLCVWMREKDFWPFWEFRRLRQVSLETHFIGLFVHWGFISDLSVYTVSAQ